MPQLADVQAAIARAMLSGNADGALAPLIGGVDVRERLAIHLRHYQASLQAALLDRFPATAWLLGSDFVASAAGAYARKFPPQAPCIAEYGAGFPAYIGEWASARALPYVESFAMLEWALGHASIAIDALPLAWQEFVSAGPDLLLDARLDLQAGLSYVRAEHGIDTLMNLYLNDQAPESFAIPEGAAAIEVRGSRGELRMTRLDSGAFEFRSALGSGESISDAAAQGLDADSNFDSGKALRELVEAGLATHIHL
jgi:hypothetical protein